MTDCVNEIEIDIDTIRKYQDSIELLVLEPAEDLVKHFIETHNLIDNGNKGELKND